MGSPAHLADEALLLHLAPELPQRLLELLRILDYDLQPEITPFFEVFPVAQATTAGLDRERLAYPRAAQTGPLTAPRRSASGLFSCDTLGSPPCPKPRSRFASRPGTPSSTS